MILKKPLFLLLFFMVVVIGILQQIAVKHFLYWTLDWFDILMHLLGGFWFGYSVLWIIFFSGYINFFKNKNLKFFIVTAFVSAFGIGVLWEIFEYVFDITFFVKGYVFDTTKDLVMDSLGGVLASVFLFKFYKKNNDLNQKENVIS
jgi:uncharacterized BrkB/YihY/UPF0761 family membrane protein